MLTRVHVQAAVLLLTAGAAFAACSSPPESGPLEAYETAGAGVFVQNLQEAPTWAFTGLTACVREVAADFKVTKVELVEPVGDVSVDGGLYFGDEPSAEVEPGRMPAHYVPLAIFDSSQVQATPCRTGKVPALAVGVEVTSRGHWEAKGVSMTYVADGSSYQVQWNLNVRVCAIGPDDAEECQDRTA